jgi:hypothetical protein
MPQTQTTHTPGPSTLLVEPSDIMQALESLESGDLSALRGQLESIMEAAPILSCAAAAAPALLEACKFIASWNPSAAPGESGGMSIMDAIDTASRAIAAAEGGG